MIDKICYVTYRIIKLLDWIILGLFSVTFVAFTISVPTLFCIYIGGCCLKSSIIFGLVFWMTIILAFAIDFAYVRGKDLEQKNNEER